MLQFVDFFSNEERIDECEICVGQIPVVPHLLCNQERAQNKWSPVSGLQGHFSKSNESVDIDEADDAALRTIRRGISMCEQNKALT